MKSKSSLFRKSLTFKLNPVIADFTVISFLVSVFSGIVVSYHYFYTDPLLSLIKFEAEVPFGRFFRNLHYFSSQLALIFGFLHLLESIIKGWYERKTTVSWFWLIISFLVLVFLVFTGYVLRFDEVGKLAGTIAENLCLSLPFIGVFLRDLFFPLSKDGIYRVYLAHIYLSFMLGIGIFVWHSSLKKFFNSKYVLYFYVNLVLPVLFYVPLESKEGDKVITGPWFFLGVQKLLEHLPPLMVILYLLTPFCALFLLKLNKIKKLLKVLLVVWIFSYVFLSLLMYKEVRIS